MPEILSDDVALGELESSCDKASRKLRNPVNHSDIELGADNQRCKKKSLSYTRFIISHQ